jgi:hypothetical protein
MVLFDTNNRIFGPYLAAIHWILISVMPRCGAVPLHRIASCCVALHMRNWRWVDARRASAGGARRARGGRVARQCADGPPGRPVIAHAEPRKLQPRVHTRQQAQGATMLPFIPPRRRWPARNSTAAFAAACLP